MHRIVASWLVVGITAAVVILAAAVALLQTA